MKLEGWKCETRICTMTGDFSDTAFSRSALIYGTEAIYVASESPDIGCGSRETFPAGSVNPWLVEQCVDKIKRVVFTMPVYFSERQCPFDAIECTGKDMHLRKQLSRSMPAVALPPVAPVINVPNVHIHSLSLVSLCRL